MRESESQPSEQELADKLRSDLSNIFSIVLGVLTSEGEIDEEAKEIILEDLRDGKFKLFKFDEYLNRANGNDWSQAKIALNNLYSDIPKAVDSLVDEINNNLRRVLGSDDVATLQRWKEEERRITGNQ